MTDYAWEPTTEYIENANVTRLMRTHGIESLAELRARSVADIGWYWDAAVKDLDLPFTTPYDRVYDDSKGIEWTRWFVGGRCNITHACVDKWRDDPAFRDRCAITAEAEDGEIRTLTFGELAREVDRVARALTASGIGHGDAVAVFMPMVPEAVIAAYAIAKLGAVYLPIFSGFAAGAIVSRLQDAEARVVLTADGTWRRGKHGEMKSTCDEAVEQCPSVEKVVVYGRLGLDVPMTSGRDVFWSEWVGEITDDSPLEAFDTDAEDTFLLAYTSGTTGKPKGSVLVHGGFLVKIASECAYQTDIHPGEVFFWVTDMGWIMGPLSMVGAHAIGATMMMFEGAPDFPDPARLWSLVERHNVTMLGVSPTLIRALRAKGDEWTHKHDLSSVRIIGSSSEPWNPEPYTWLSQQVFGGRVPIINLSGGTEVGACFLSPFPVEPIKTCSLGGISLGMDMDVFDPAGSPLREQVGELVCKQPWPAMTRGIWGDPQRFIDSYWSMYAGVWRHGDWARIDEDGQWFLYGRSDEAINVAGKRVGPAEVESVLVSHPAVSEAATIGVPDETKGEAIWCFWVGRDPGGPDVSPELVDLIIEEMGKPFKPARVVRVDALPKTRSAKILRRAIRAVVIGEDPGDLSSAENPQALDAIRTTLGLQVPA